MANVLPLHTCTPSDSRVFLRGDRQEGSRDERLGATDPPGSRAKRCQGQGLAAGAAARGGQAPRRRLLASRRLRCAGPRRRPPRRRRRPRAPSAHRPGSAPGNHPYAPRAPLVASLGSFPTSLRRPGTPPCDEESELAPDDPVPSSLCARCRGRRAPPVHQRRGLGAVVSRCPPASPTSSVATWTGRLSPISSFPGQRADPCGPQAGASASDTRRFGRPACHLCVPTIYATRLSPNGSPTGRTRSRSPRSPVTRRSASHSIATGTSSQPRTRS